MKDGGPGHIQCHGKQDSRRYTDCDDDGDLTVITGKAISTPILFLLTLLSVFSSIAAEISACDLVDEATASQIMGRPVAAGPRASNYALTDNVRSNCHFGAEGAPVTFVTVSVSEFKTPIDAKAWADKANTPTDRDFSTEMEESIGDSVVWVSGQHAAGYVVRKGTRVLEVNIRGAAAGEQPFQVIPAMRPQMRRAMLRAMEKL